MEATSVAAGYPAKKGGGGLARLIFQGARRRLTPSAMTHGAGEKDGIGQ